MAARRLIVVLLVLFGISIVAAAIAPERRGPLSSDESTTSTSTSETTAPAPVDSGEVVAARIEADAADPETVRAEPGDQLELLVGAPGAVQVEIEPFGLLEQATADAPAAFNVLLREAGTVPITDAQGGEIIGRIVIGAEPAQEGDSQAGDAQRPQGHEEDGQRATAEAV